MKAAVLGSPIAHSRSPELHRAAYAALGIRWTYERYEVGSGGLAGFVAAHAGEFRGLSLTMPLKEEAFAVAEQHDVASTLTRVCNTLVLDSPIMGYNTDVIGFVEALRYRGVSVPEAATILGTGATARSALIAMLEFGVKRVHVVGRRAEALADFVTWAPTEAITTSDWNGRWDPTGLTISTTTAGATDDVALPDQPGTLFDVIYAPWPTKFAKRWAEGGGIVLGGIDLLVHQAAEQVLLMTQTDAGARSRIVHAMYETVGESGA